MPRVDTCNSALLNPTAKPHPLGFHRTADGKEDSLFEDPNKGIASNVLGLNMYAL